MAYTSNYAQDAMKKYGDGDPPKSKPEKKPSSKTAIKTLRDKKTGKVVSSKKITLKPSSKKEMF